MPFKAEDGSFSGMMHGFMICSYVPLLGLTLVSCDMASPDSLMLFISAAGDLIVIICVIFWWVFQLNWLNWQLFAIIPRPR